MKSTALPPFYLQSVKSSWLKWGDIEINPGNGNSHFHWADDWAGVSGYEGWMPISICIQLTTNFLPSFPLASLLLFLWYQFNPTDRLFPQHCLTSFLPSFLLYSHWTQPFGKTHAQAFDHMPYLCIKHIKQEIQQSWTSCHQLPRIPNSCFCYYCSSQKASATRSQ